MTRREALAVFVAPVVAAQTGRDDDAFVKLANECIAETLARSPEMATSLGEHRYDDRLSDASAAGIRRETAAYRGLLRRLAAIPLGPLDAVNRIDYQILKSRLESSIWTAETLREHEWNPTRYNPAGAIYLLLEREFAPLPDRLGSVRKRLERVPEFLEAGKANLRDTPQIHTETAIAQNKGAINVVRGLVDSFAAKAPEMKAELAPAQEKAVAALESWGAWLEKEKLPKARRDFRIGASLYRAKLRYTLQSGMSADQIRARAERDLRETQAVMYDTASGLYGKLFPGQTVPRERAAAIRAVLDKLAESAPKPNTILQQATRELQSARAFIEERSLATLYDTPLKIVEMPEFQRGVAVASCASPGPLEANGITFFNISPAPANWDKAQVDSYFREYNDYMVRNLVVHEAMPGHYLQRAHANRFKAPTLIRAIFSSGTFTEGWAVYAERFMAEQGFGGGEVRMQQLKMRLRTIINALIDQGIHSGGMTEQQAMDLMMNSGYQERSEAAGKWRRASLTSTQLTTYYAGTTELDQIREDYLKTNPNTRDWRGFHDRMLSFGSPAPGFVRELMGV